jgi:hypothetical protein
MKRARNFAIPVVADRVLDGVPPEVDISIARSPAREYGGSMARPLWIVVLLCACGEPILKNAPKPDPGSVAGVAAAAAAAATLASPEAAARRQEQLQKGEPDNRGVKVEQTVPADVLDRLDHAPQGASVDGGRADPSPPASGAPASDRPASGAPGKVAPSTSAPATTAPATNTPARTAPARKTRPPVIPPPSSYTPKQ